MINWRGLLAWVETRFSEKSTWTGLIALVAAASGHAFAPDVAPQIDGIAAGLAGLVLIATKTQGTVNSPFAVGLLCVTLLVPLAGCVTTDSSGAQVVVTPANFTDLVKAKVVAECPKAQALEPGAAVIATAVSIATNQPGIAVTEAGVAAAFNKACADLTANATAAPVAAPASGG